MLLRVCYDVRAVPAVNQKQDFTLVGSTALGTTGSWIVRRAWSQHLPVSVTDFVSLPARLSHATRIHNI